MTVNSSKEGTTLTVEIEGRIDTQTAPDLEEKIKASIEGVKDLVLDFTRVSYISSPGLRTILKSQNWMDAAEGTMVIHGAGKNIVNVFKVTGLDSFLTLE